jgi:hypothetical protein
MLVLVLAQTAMPTAVYAKGFGHYVPSPRGVTYFGGSANPPGWSSPFPGSGHPMPRPGAPPVQQLGGYVPGGAGTVIRPFYYWYSDPYYHYYYCYDNGRYYYCRTPR